MIYQLKKPKYTTSQYEEAVRTGKVYLCNEIAELEYKNLLCPNCGIHIGDKVKGATFYQPFLCPRCKGIFVYDLRYFRTQMGIGISKDKWQKDLGII